MTFTVKYHAQGLVENIAKTLLTGQKLLPSFCCVCLARNVRAVDYRACAKSQLTQQEINQELGLVCGYLHSTTPTRSQPQLYSARSVSSPSTPGPEEGGSSRSEGNKDTMQTADCLTDARSSLRPLVLISETMMYATSAIEPSLQYKHRWADKGRLFLAALKQLQPSPCVLWKGGHERPPCSLDEGHDAHSYYRQWTCIDGYPAARVGKGETHAEQWKQIMVLHGPPQVRTNNYRTINHRPTCSAVTLSLSQCLQFNSPAAVVIELVHNCIILLLSLISCLILWPEMYIAFANVL